MTPETSYGYRLIELVETYVRLPSGEPVVLADYEKSILIRALERYPANWPVESLRGLLRYRTFLLSMARRNHKTSLMSYIGLWCLLQHRQGSSAVIVSPTADQSRIAYGYARTALIESDDLSAVIKPSKSQGLQRHDGTGTLRILTGTEKSLNGFGLLYGVMMLDEAHETSPAVYSMLRGSMRSTRDGMILIASTAGTVESVLYKSLLKQADDAMAGEDERFGAIILEGHEGASLDDEASIRAANPAIDAGYFSLDEALREARDTSVPDHMKRRYLHNLQISTSENPWIADTDWTACAGTGLTNFDDCVFAIDVSPGDRYATIIAAKQIDGIVKTAVVAFIDRPTLPQLQEWIKRLKKNRRATFVMDSYRLNLCKFIEDKNWPLIKVGGATRVEATSMVYAAIKAHSIEHDGNPWVAEQNRKAKIKDLPNGFVIVPTKNVPIDSAYATMWAVYGAMTNKVKKVYAA